MNEHDLTPHADDRDDRDDFLAAALATPAADAEMRARHIGAALAAFDAEIAAVSGSDRGSDATSGGGRVVSIGSRDGRRSSTTTRRTAGRWLAAAAAVLVVGAVGTAVAQGVSTGSDDMATSANESVDFGLVEKDAGDGAAGGADSDAATTQDAASSPEAAPADEPTTTPYASRQGTASATASEELSVPAPGLTNELTLTMLGTFPDIATLGTAARRSMVSTSADPAVPVAPSLTACIPSLSTTPWIPRFQATVADEAVLIVVAANPDGSVPSDATLGLVRGSDCEVVAL